MPLRIANWSRFEPSDAKKCKFMQWVAVPINHSGLGYLEIMSHPDGIRMIGGWLLILQVAAQCPERGLLVSDSGRILGAREIALKTRANEKDISDCIELLCENGWLIDSESSGRHPDGIRTASGLQDSTGQDKTEQNKKAAAAAQPCKEEIANQAAAAASIDDLLEKPDKTAIIARRHTLGDLKQAFPVFITFRNDEDEARTMFDLWGWETLAQAIGILTPIARGRPAGKQRITVSELTQWLAAHGSLEAEDYKRAGLPVPENIK